MAPVAGDLLESSPSCRSRVASCFGMSGIGAIATPNAGHPEANAEHALFLAGAMAFLLIPVVASFWKAGNKDCYVWQTPGAHR
jgi:hypothetical protein